MISSDKILQTSVNKDQPLFQTVSMAKLTVLGTRLMHYEIALLK